MPAAVLQRWDWRISGHARLASLGAAWVLLLLVSAPAALLFPLAGMRMAASPVQLFLNHRLNRRQPLEKRDWLDWFLFGLAFVASMAVSVAQQGAPGIPTALLLSSVLLPLSIIQLRAASRSYRAHRERFAIHDSGFTIHDSGFGILPAAEGAAYSEREAA